MSEPKTPTSQEIKPVREIDEQTQKHIDRFLQGKEVWNKWANEMLAKKEALEKAGKWKVKVGSDGLGRYRSMSADHSTPEIQIWLDETYVDFSNLSFLTEPNSFLQEGRENKSSVKSILVSGKVIDFSGFIFLNDASFIECKFRGQANFGEANFQVVYFNDAEFRGNVYFDQSSFLDWSSFNRCKFKNRSVFDKAKFHKGSDFHKAEFQSFTDFNNVVFQRFVNFQETVFKNETSFSNAQFQKGVDFMFANFQRRVAFSKANFLVKANFFGVGFNDVAKFEDTKFLGWADFRISNFNGVQFVSAKFEMGAYFGLTVFKRYADFSNTKFKHETNFEAILVKRAFNLAEAEFSEGIPNYTQANFGESPRLDNVKVLPAPELKKSPLGWQRYFWTKNYLPYLKRLSVRYLFQYPNHIWNKFTNNRRNPDEEAHYRALKRLAIQAHDHENEMKFFAGEIRARRHITDFMWPWKKGFASSARYWAGVAYELFSDFGRSFIRPTLWWFACLWLFASLTLSGAGLMDKTKCHNSQLTPKEAAYTIGLKNSLLILGLTKTNIVKQAELCLYGVNKNGEAENKPKSYDPKVKRAYQAKPTKAETTKTDIPFKAAVQGIAHSLLSLLFIFLLLLAIRNQFKIK